MADIELLKNIYVSSTITGFLDDPHQWLEGREDFPVRYVGGIHNLSAHDKEIWARDANGPIRIVESETGREEIWYGPTQQAPDFISVDANGNIHSHLKYDSPVPAVKQGTFMRPTIEPGFLMTVSVWYAENVILREDDGPAVNAGELLATIQDEEAAEYIRGVKFTCFWEFWRDGEWKDTSASGIEFLFANEQLNTEENKAKAAKWIEDHCTGGFFPLDAQLFGEKDEEFMFVADICS